MPMETVYLAPAHANDSPEELTQKVELLWKRAALSECFHDGDITALKLHVGEPGCRTFVSPDIAAGLVGCLRESGARPFLTDTVVLYRSPRDNGVDHAAVAVAHGFTAERTGAPFFPADGPTGSDGVDLPVDGRHFKQVSIAGAIDQAHSLLVLSHATGHLGTGFGGAIKNLGMGCATRKGKLAMHAGHNPRIKPDDCVACGFCIDICPAEAIAMTEKAAIDQSTCIGCGECLVLCPEEAIHFNWSIGGTELQERIVEYASPIIRRKRNRMACVTVAMNITKNCDCLGLDEKPVVEDIGILASRDPVAIDMAVLKLVRERSGQSLESLSFPRLDASRQIDYGREMEIGTDEIEIEII